MLPALPEIVFVAPIAGSSASTLPKSGVPKRAISAWPKTRTGVGEDSSVFAIRDPVTVIFSTSSLATSSAANTDCALKERPVTKAKLIAWLTSDLFFILNSYGIFASTGVYNFCCYCRFGKTTPVRNHIIRIGSSTELVFATN